MALTSTHSLHLRGVKPTVLAAYKFDEGSGTTTADATGNGHNGTLVSGAGFGPGRYGGGILFSGANQSVNFPQAGLEPARLGISWCFWAKFPASGRPPFLGLITKLRISQSTRSGMAIDSSSLFHMARWRDQLNFTTTGTAPTDAGWHFYASSDGDNGFSLWLDGVVIRSGTRAGLAVGTDNTAWESFPWQLGTADNQFDTMAGFSISDFRILSGEMNIDDVLHYMNTPC